MGNRAPVVTPDIGRPSGDFMNRYSPLNSPLKCYRLVVGVYPRLILAFILLVVLVVILETPTMCNHTLEEKPLKNDAARNNPAARVYQFAIHPLYNPRKLFEAYQPLIDYLNSNLTDAQFELEASRDYDAYEKKFRARTPEFLLPNPWQSLQAMKAGYHVIAMAGDPEDFKGIFIVRRDSGIKTPSDLKGKTVSYPSPTALAACIMPQYFLHRQGIDINKDIINAYVGSQESSIMNVYLGQAAAGATWPPPWRLFQKDHPKEAAQLELIWETPAMLNNSVMVRDDVAPTLVARVRQLLLDLEHHPDGPAIFAGMSTGRFHAADDARYQQVEGFITDFEREVRPVEQR